METEKMNNNSKYMVSADIEGVSGVANTQYSNIDDRCYQQARKLMVMNVNAVIKGVLKADSTAQVIVRDAHGGATNLCMEDLHPEASLIQGWGNGINMVQGIDNSYDGVLLVGYHAGAENKNGVLAHTLTRSIRSITINGKMVNEAGWAGLFAGHYNVPVIFLSGDDHAVAEAKEQFDAIETVEVKLSIARDCAMSYPLERTAQQLEEGAYRAVNKIVPPFKTTLPLEVKLHFFDVGYDKSQFQSLSEILSFDESYSFDHVSRCVAYQAQSQLEAFQRFSILFYLFSGLGQF